MKLIEKLTDMIEDELEDAERYAHCALAHKGEQPALADTFFRLSNDEMSHADQLHKQVVDMIAEYRRANGEPPEIFPEILLSRTETVELEDGARLEDVTAAIKADPYFANDETHVFAVESVDAVRDMGHGVHLVRKGVSGKTQNQRLEFNMSINNPALTAQVLVNVARASLRQQPGCYTMVEIPVIDMLPGERADLIEHLG